MSVPLTKHWNQNIILVSLKSTSSQVNLVRRLPVYIHCCHVIIDQRSQQQYHARQSMKRWITLAQRYHLMKIHRLFELRGSPPPSLLSQMKQIWEELGPKINELLELGKAGVVASIVAPC